MKGVIAALRLCVDSNVTSLERPLVTLLTCTDEEVFDHCTQGLFLRLVIVDPRALGLINMSPNILESWTIGRASGDERRKVGGRCQVEGSPSETTSDGATRRADRRWACHPSSQVSTCWSLSCVSHHHCSEVGVDGLALKLLQLLANRRTCTFWAAGLHKTLHHLHLRHGLNLLRAHVVEPVHLRIRKKEGRKGEEEGCLICDVSPRSSPSNLI